MQLYNKLLQIEYSPIAALNRTYILAKANGKEQAIIEAEKLNLRDNYFYYSLLGHLYTDIEDSRALAHFQTAFSIVGSTPEKVTIKKVWGDLLQSKTLDEFTMKGYIFSTACEK